jgi:hypothetical protein
LLPKICLENLWENPGGQSLKPFGWGEIECPSPEIDPPNHLGNIGNFHVHGRRTLPARLWWPRTHNSPIFSTWFGGSISWLGHSISPQPRRFRVCPPFYKTFQDKFFW